MAAAKVTRHGDMETHKPHRNMCYPLYKYEQETEKPYQPAEGWICFSSGALGIDSHEASLELYARMDQVRNFNNAGDGPIANEAEAHAA